WRDDLSVLDGVRRVRAGTWPLGRLLRLCSVLGWRPSMRAIVREAVVELGGTGLLEAWRHKWGVEPEWPAWVRSNVTPRSHAPASTLSRQRVSTLRGWSWEQSMRWMTHVGRTCDVQFVEPLLTDTVFDYVQQLPPLSFRAGVLGRRIWRD